MSEPTPIRRRIALVCDECGTLYSPRCEHMRAWTSWSKRLGLGGRAVEVVPVPDEQAIERAAKALARRYGEEVGFADWLGIARTVASALEPPE